MAELCSSQFFTDIITTLIGVFAGGLLTILVNIISERKRMKLELEIKSLSTIIPLLREYSFELTNQGIYIMQLDNVNDYKSPRKSQSVLVSLITEIDINKYVLNPFHRKLTNINKMRLRIEGAWAEEKQTLIKLSEKFKEDKVSELMKNAEVAVFLEDNCKKYYELHEYILSLIDEMNEYYLKKLFRVNKRKE